MKTEKKNNAHRLAFALSCIADDSYRIQYVAKFLNYESAQFKIDLKDLFSYLSDLERKINEEEC